MTPTRERELSQMESKEVDVRKSTSGSRGFETTGRTTEPTPTDPLFEKSKVPEIPARSETGRADDRDIGNLTSRDRRSGSKFRSSTLCEAYLRQPEDAGERCGCRRGDAC